MLASLAFVFACAQPDPAEHDLDDTGGVASVTCSAEPQSSCGDPASVVRTVVHAGAEGPSTGDLVVYLTHHSMGNEQLGGYYHIGALVPDVDLGAGPVAVDLDMCAGGEMWSAEWGDFNIVAILDQDGSNKPAEFDSDHPPERGEPSVRVSPITLVAGGDSPCYDNVVLACLDGRGCVSY